MNQIITIGRETGSGGLEIGQILAGRLGISCYDRQLLTRAAEESGLDRNLFVLHDEKPANSLLYSLALGSHGGGAPSAAMHDLPLDQKVFLAQFETIRRIADEGPAIIVGRCADYALEGKAEVLSIFVKAEMPDKIRRIMDRNQLSEDKARDFIRKNDRRRGSYYSFYANRKWGDARSYDICLNSSLFGMDGCADIILSALDKMKRTDTASRDNR